MWFLPGGHNFTREEQGVDGVCKEVIIMMVHGLSAGEGRKSGHEGGEEQWGERWEDQ